MAALIIVVVEVTANISVAWVLCGDWPQEFIYLLFLHVTFGNIITQATSTASSRLPGIVSVASVENLAIFKSIRCSLSSSMPGASPQAQLMTFVVISSLCSFVGAVMVGAASHPTFLGLLNTFPDHVRTGVFAGIGICLFLLGFDTFGLSPYNAATWTSMSNWLKWCPAYLLGVFLWYLDERCSCTSLMVIFTAVVTASAHVAFMAADISMHEAVAEGYLLGKIDAQWFFEYYVFVWQNADKVSFAAVWANMHQVIVAAFVGPLLNVAINLLVLKTKFDGDYTWEFRSQALSLLATACGGGYNAFVAVSDTEIMHKAGGKTSRATALVAMLLLGVCVAKPVCPLIVLLIPSAMVGAFFVYIGLAIAKGCLLDEMVDMRPAEKLCVVTVVVICVIKSVLHGLLFGLLFDMVLAHFRARQSASGSQGAKDVLLIC